MPGRHQLPDAEHALVLALAREQREISHGVAILVEDRLPNFVVPAPSVDDQEIKIVPASVQNDKAKSLRFQICLPRQKRTRQPIDLIRYLSRYATA